MSIALKLEPRWPEPARLTAVSAFSRHMSATRGTTFVAEAVVTEPRELRREGRA